jgi:endonuclease/exonuclease/phosphatase family metal-dependent hydrolase
MAYNVHGFHSGARGVAEAVGGARPDVALLNEVDYLSVRLRRFARLMGMRWASGLGLWRPVPNAVLVRPPWRIVDKRLVRLPRTERTIRRGALIATIGRAGFRVTAAAIHLGLSQRERVRHTEALTDLLAGRDPVVAGGDYNEGPDGRAVSWMAARYWDAFGAAGDGDGFTFPAPDPRARIDYVFVSQTVQVRRAWTGDATEGSDHLPVFADVELEG